MKKLKLFALIILLIQLMSISVFADTVGEDNGTPPAIISTTPNEESNYIYNSTNTSIKWIENYNTTGTKISVSFPGIYEPGKPFYDRTNFDSNVLSTNKKVTFYAFLAASGLSGKAGRAIMS